MKVKIGCCGFPVGRENYFEHFPVVEIQKTFYQPPSLRTLERLRSQAPRGFEFTLKAWQLITHQPSSPTYRRLTLSIPDSRKDNYGYFKPTKDVFDAWQNVSLIAQILQARIVLFQCPPSFRPTPDNKTNMRRFFETIHRGNLQLVWEPRGTWSDDEIRELCQELNLVHCVDPFKRSSTRGETKYFRLHGKTGYRYQYTQQDLEQLSGWVEGDVPCYAMFNNTGMFRDAMRFREMIGD